MALTEIKTSGIADDAVTTDKLANAINTERTANTSKPSLANDANNRVVTGDGSGGLNGEANLTFDGSLLTTKGSGEIVRVESTQASGNCYLSFQDSSARKGYIGYGAGNDPFYIVQDEDADIIVYSNGANRVQFKPDGDVNIVDGDLVIGTSGHGIDFSATGSSGTSERFCDYEEGTWVPDPHDGTCNYSNARYIRVGNVCHIWALCDTFSDTTTNDQIGITGIPFTPVSNGVKGSAMYRYADDANKTVVYFSSTPRIHFYGGNTGGYTQLRHNEINSSNFEVYFHATYDVT